MSTFTRPTGRRRQSILNKPACITADASSHSTGNCERCGGPVHLSVLYVA